MPRTSNNDRILAEHPAVRALLKPNEIFGEMTRVECRIARPDASFIWRRGDSGEHARFSQEIMGAKRVKKEVDEIYAFWHDEANVFDLSRPTTRAELDRGHAKHQFQTYYWPTSTQPYKAYVRDLFLKGNDISGPAWATIPDLKIVVWVTIKSFYEATDEPWEPGKHLETELDVTIYKPPVMGWLELAKTASPRDVPLSSRDIINGVLSHHRELWEPVSSELGSFSKRIENEVYFNGLKKIIDDEPRSRGMTGHFGDITLMTYSLAGRINVQIERGDVTFNSLGAEDEVPARFGTQASYGTCSQINALVDAFITRWKGLSQAARTEVVRPSGASYGF